MAIDPITLALGGASILGGFLGADKAADAQKEASQAAIGEQRRQFDTLVGLSTPAINTGNAARSTLASILGLSVPTTSPLGPSAKLGEFQVAGAGGKSPSLGGGLAGLAAGGLTGGLLGGALGGRVESKNRPIAQSDLDRLLQYVRDNPDKYDERGEVQGLLNRNRPGAQGQILNALAQNELGYFAPQEAAPAAPPEDLQARLEAYPGFQFAVDQARRASVAQASATGSSPISGNVLTALQNDISGRISLPVFQDYVNRLANLAGTGQTAGTNLGVQTSGISGNIAGLLQNQGDARASGILTGTGAALGTLGGLAQVLGRNRIGGGTNPVGGYDFNRTFPVGP